MNDSNPSNSHTSLGADRLQLQGNGPWYVELPQMPDAEWLFRRIARRNAPLWLDSADTQSPLGTCSFMAWDPFERWSVPVDAANPLPELSRRLSKFAASRVAELPRFQGGAAGLWGYDLARSLERLPVPRIRDLELPALELGLYDRVVAWDHRARRAWVIAHGFPESSLEARRDRAIASLEEALRLIGLPANGSVHRGDHRSENRSDSAALPEFQPMARMELAATYPMPQYAGVSSNFSREGFQQAVARGIEAIRAGDIFQVNLAHRLAVPATQSAAELYLRMRRRNAAPFAAYFDFGSAKIVSASPERLFQVRDGIVESRPIKGTTQRSSYPESDLAAAGVLQASPKDRAENVMIVDLLRNDLSRVCDDDSICVTQLCDIERYRYVQHLVSAITGRLLSNKTAVDVVQALFPGGSITGAPKIRAMELIAEIEPTPRGAYCGSLGYLGFDGSADLNILIRTVTDAGGWWTFPVGGGIVVQSEPESELTETWHKARGLLQAVLS